MMVEKRERVLVYVAHCTKWLALVNMKETNGDDYA